MKPMLAVEVDLDKLKYPVLCSPKLDGIRAVVKEGVLLSRSLKPIRNDYAQFLFKHLEGYDGELVIGDPTDEKVFQETSSGIMSKQGTPSVKYYVFDRWDKKDSPYQERHKEIFGSDDVVVVESILCNNQDELLKTFKEYLEAGYEGMMVRDPEQGYKYGRSTKNSQHLLKMKEFIDEEFLVVGFTEMLTNNNEVTKNALGYSERSSKKAGKVGAGMLGSLVVQADSGDTFEVGTGFDHETRKYIWENQLDFLGKLAKVKYQTQGKKDLPRFPVFIGFRDKEDL